MYKTKSYALQVLTFSLQVLSTLWLHLTRWSHIICLYVFKKTDTFSMTTSMTASKRWLLNKQPTTSRRAMILRTLRKTLRIKYHVSDSTRMICRKNRSSKFSPTALDQTLWTRPQSWFWIQIWGIKVQRSLHTTRLDRYTLHLSQYTLTILNSYGTQGV